MTTWFEKTRVSTEIQAKLDVNSAQTVDISLNTQNLHWIPDNSLNRLALNDTLKPWLCDNNSLTALLIDLGGATFQVEVVSQFIGQPNRSEQSKIAMNPGQAAMIREVNLRIYEEPVVFARSIIPLSLSGRGGGGLATLGQTPLGHLLFKNGRIRVSKRDVFMPTKSLSILGARRTPYEYLGDTILVSEFFLPSLKKYW